MASKIDSLWIWGRRLLNVLKPTGHVMHQQFNIQQLYVLPTLYLCVCIYLRTNSDLCHLQHKLIGFYNRDEKCLLQGTNWVFKYSSLRFVFKGLIIERGMTYIKRKCNYPYQTAALKAPMLFTKALCTKLRRNPTKVAARKTETAQVFRRKNKKVVQDSLIGLQVWNRVIMISLLFCKKRKTHERSILQDTQKDCSVLRITNALRSGIPSSAFSFLKSQLSFSTCL